MENRDDKDLYHSLSKKELQELCRRYGLSPYMTKPNLVDALYSYLKRKNVSPIFQVESSSVHPASLISPVEYESKSYSLVHAPKDSYQNINRPGEKRNRKNYSQNVKCSIKQNSKGAESYNKVSGSRIVRDLEYPLYEVGENFRLTCKRRETFVSQKEPGYNENHFYAEKPRKISFSNHSLSFAREVGESMDQGACLAENASTSSIKSPKSIPSFEFYIRSEEGINLIVDLNSSLSDWSNRLESGLCCYNVVDNKFGSLRKELQLLGKSNTATKGSFLQNTDAEHEMIDGCVDSSKKGFDNIAVDQGFGVDEEPLLFSLPNSVVQNHVTSGAESNPIDTEAIPVESSVRPSTNCQINSMLGGLEISLEHQNLEVGNKNCEDLMGQNTCTDKGPSLVDPGSLLTGSTEMQSLEVISQKDDLRSTCRNNNLSDVVDPTVDAETRDDELSLEHQNLEVGKKNCEDLTGQNTCIDMGPSLVYPGSLSFGSTQMQSPEVVSQKDDSCSPWRINNLPDVVDLTHDAETRDDELAYSSTCHNHMSACVYEMEKSDVMDGVQFSESFQFTKSPEKTSEDSEAYNVQKRKVQHSKGKYLKLCDEYNARILRSRKHLMERVLPRRSMRLVTK